MHRDPSPPFNVGPCLGLYRLLANIERGRGVFHLVLSGILAHCSIVDLNCQLPNSVEQKQAVTAIQGGALPHPRIPFSASSPRILRGNLLMILKITAGPTGNGLEPGSILSPYSLFQHQASSVRRDSHGTLAGMSDINRLPV